MATGVIIELKLWYYAFCLGHLGNSKVDKQTMESQEREKKLRELDERLGSGSFKVYALDNLPRTQRHSYKYHIITVYYDPGTPWGDIGWCWEIDSKFEGFGVHRCGFDRSNSADKALSKAKNYLDNSVEFQPDDMPYLDNTLSYIKYLFRMSFEQSIRYQKMK